MKTDMILVAVPRELLEEAGIDVGDALEMYERDGSLVIRQLEDCGLCPRCRCRER